MSATVATEFRAHPRLAPTIIRAEVERDGERQQGYLINVSLGDAFLAVENPPATESTVEVFLLLPWGVDECKIKAQAVWQQVDAENRPIGAGLSFVGVSDEVKGKLQSYLERFITLSAEITKWAPPVQAKTRAFWPCEYLSCGRDAP
jgi:hypothetical protein